MKRQENTLNTHYYWKSVRNQFAKVTYYMSLTIYMTFIMKESRSVIAWNLGGEEAWGWLEDGHKEWGMEMLCILIVMTFVKIHWNRSLR